MGEYYDVYPKDVWRDPNYKAMDKFSLAGKKGFVTGGCGGIGRNVIAAWAEAGADVALVDIPQVKEAGEKLAKELSDRYGRKIIFVPCDVSDKAQVDAMKDTLKKELGTIDIAHINAGVCLADDNSDIDYETMKKTIDIDLIGALLTAQVAQNIMREDGHGGSIIFTASLTGFACNNFAGFPSPAMVYGACKAGLYHIAQHMAGELAQYGIRVNTISPGYMWSGIHEGRMDKDGHDLSLVPVPMKRYAKTEDVHGLMVYLASEASSYVTGINIHLDGGYSIF